MFPIDLSEQYWYPVQVELVDEDGKKKKFDFDARFERLDVDERRDLLVREEGDERPPANDRQICERVLCGWRKVSDGEGADVPVNDENRDRLIKIPEAARGIVTAWLKSIGVEGKAKN